MTVSVESKESREYKEVGTVGVDSGMLMIVDPAYLFSEEEWNEICELALAADLAETIPNPPEIQRLIPDLPELHKLDPLAFPNAILKVLSKRTGHPMEKLATVFHTHVGDGRYTVRDKGDSFDVDA